SAAGAQREMPSSSGFRVGHEGVAKGLSGGAGEGPDLDILRATMPKEAARRTVTILARIRSSCSSLLALPFLCGTASAQSPQAAPVNHLDDTYRVEASAADLVLGTTMNIGTTERPGTEVGIEDLGIERGAFSPRFAFGWHPRRRHEFEIGY